MVALNFPDSPAIDEIFVAPNGVEYQFDGQAWNVISAAAGVPGPVGPAGDSAYEVAVTEGFVGTEQEWLDSLVGPEGIAGPQGQGIKYLGRVETQAELDAVIGITDFYEFWIVNENGVGYQAVPMSELPGGKGWFELGRLVGQNGANGVDGADGISTRYMGRINNYTELEALTPGAKGGQFYIANDTGEGYFALTIDNPDVVTAWEPMGRLVGQDGSVGETGADGASAYQVALQNGFVGTEEEWLASLEGEQGPQGLGLRYAGRVPTAADLGSLTGQIHGDVYVADDTGVAYVWNTTVDPARFDDAGPVVGAAGADGQTGLSAYQVAVANGFTGTEQEWLDSLIGPAGPTATSSDAGNISKLGTDGLLFTPSTDLSGYLPKAGGTMTGTIVAPTGIPAMTWGPSAGIGSSGENVAIYASGTSFFDVRVNDAISSVPVILPADPTTDLQAATKKYVDAQVAAGGALPIATASRLGGVKIGTGLNVTADGTISTTASTNYVSKNGDVMNGPLRYSDIGGVSTFNGADVYTYFGGGFFRIHLPSGKSGLTIESATAKVTFSAVPKTAYPPVIGDDLTNKTYVDSAITDSTIFLKRSGGEMTGAITAPSGSNFMLVKGTSFAILGGSGGIAIRSGTTNLLNASAANVTFGVPIQAPATGTGIQFGSGGPAFSKSGTNIAVSTFITTANAPTDATHLANKAYVDSKPTIVSLPAGGTAPAASSYPNNTLLVEYAA